MSKRRDEKKPPGRLLFTDFDASSKGRRPSVSMSGGALPFFPAKSYPTLKELAADLDFSFEDDFDDDASTSFPSSESSEDSDSDSEARDATDDDEAAELPTDEPPPESPPTESTIPFADAFDHAGDDASNEDVPDGENQATEDDWLDRFDDFHDVAEPDILSLIPPEPLDIDEDGESRNAYGRGVRRRRSDRPRRIASPRSEPYGGIQRVENWYSPPEDTEVGMHGHPEALDGGGNERRAPSDSTRKYLAAERAIGGADAARSKAIADAESLFGGLDMESLLHADADGDSWSESSGPVLDDTLPDPDVDEWRENFDMPSRAAGSRNEEADTTRIVSAAADSRPDMSGGRGSSPRTSASSSAGADSLRASRDAAPDARMLFAPSASVVAATDAMNTILDAADFAGFDGLWAEDDVVAPPPTASTAGVAAVEHPDARGKHSGTDDTDILPAEISKGAVASVVGEGVAEVEAEVDGGVGTTRRAGIKQAVAPEVSNTGEVASSGVEPQESEDDELADSLPDIVSDDVSESDDRDTAVSSPGDNDVSAGGGDSSVASGPDGGADTSEASLDGTTDDAAQNDVFGGGVAVAGGDGADATSGLKAGEGDGAATQREEAQALDPHDVFASMDAALFDDGGLDDEMKAMMQEDAAVEGASSQEEEIGAPGKTDGRSRIRRRFHLTKTLADINAMVAWHDNWWLYCDLAAAIIAAASLAVILSYFLWYR